MWPYVYPRRRAPRCEIIYRTWVNKTMDGLDTEKPRLYDPFNQLRYYFILRLFLSLYPFPFPSRIQLK